MLTQHLFASTLTSQCCKWFIISGYNEGNVYVKHGSKWGLVCDDGWNARAATVVCRQLGFKRLRRLTKFDHFKTTTDGNGNPYIILIRSELKFSFQSCYGFFMLEGQVYRGFYITCSFLDEIFLDDMRCKGRERNIGACRHNGWFRHNCRANEAAGVVCVPPPLHSITTPKPKFTFRVIGSITTTPTIPTQPTTTSTQKPTATTKRSSLGIYSFKV